MWKLCFQLNYELQKLDLRKERSFFVRKSRQEFCPANTIDEMWENIWKDWTWSMKNSFTFFICETILKITSRTMFPTNIIARTYPLFPFDDRDVYQILLHSQVSLKAKQLTYTVSIIVLTIVFMTISFVSYDFCSKAVLFSSSCRLKCLCDLLHMEVGTQVPLQSGSIIVHLLRHVWDCEFRKGRFLVFM